MHGSKFVASALSPSATAMAVAVGPAMTMAMTRDNVRTAHDSTNGAADNRARRSGNDGTRASTDGCAFKRAGLRGERKSGERQYKQSGFYDGAHIHSPVYRVECASPSRQRMMEVPHQRLM
jgi:hypothetical protein